MDYNLLGLNLFILLNDLAITELILKYFNRLDVENIWNEFMHCLYPLA